MARRKDYNSRRTRGKENQGKNCQRQRYQQAGKDGERGHWALGGQES